MKTASLLLTIAVSRFACAARARTARLDEIYCNKKMPRDGRPSATTPTAEETSLFRSHAELDMGNPGCKPPGWGHQSCLHDHYNPVRPPL